MLAIWRYLRTVRCVLLACYWVSAKTTFLVAFWLINFFGCLTTNYVGRRVWLYFLFRFVIAIFRIVMGENDMPYVVRFLSVSVVSIVSGVSFISLGLEVFRSCQL